MQDLCIWLGYLDSNQGVTESKSVALPLGYSPIVILVFVVTKLIIQTIQILFNRACGLSLNHLIVANSTAILDIPSLFLEVKGDTTFISTEHHIM
jgi:hypothetical protein